MSDTIELLETIGKNAALRHASAEELAHTLEQTDASAALKAAVKSGDSSLLSAEFGHNKPLRVDHSPHAPPHEDEPDHEHEKDDPRQPHEPDPGKPSPDR